jgi:hypothetical protein
MQALTYVVVYWGKAVPVHSVPGGHEGRILPPMVALLQYSPQQLEPRCLFHVSVRSAVTIRCAIAPK